jgi:hypothetical protein
MEWWFIAAAGLLFMGILIRGLCQVAAEADAEIERMQRLATQGDDVDRRPVLVAFANAREVRYVRYKHKLKIEDIPWENFKEKYSGLVLFGSCGDLMNGGGKLPVNNLIHSSLYYNIDVSSGDTQQFHIKGKFLLIGKRIKNLRYVSGICTSTNTAIHTALNVYKVLYRVNKYFNVKDFTLLDFVVDMESGKLARCCFMEMIPFISIRYITDRCEKRVMPWGINHFWRIYQDWRMQRMFDRLMMEVCGE